MKQRDNELPDFVDSGQWLFVFVLLAIPGINLLYLVFLALSNANASKVYFARAVLLILLFFAFAGSAVYLAGLHREPADFLLGKLGYRNNTRPMHAFYDRQGVKLEAHVLDFPDSKHVILLRKDGRKFRVPIRSFSPSGPGLSPGSQKRVSPPFGGGEKILTLFYSSHNDSQFLFPLGGLAFPPPHSARRLLFP